MTAVDVRTPAGKASGSVELPAEIFDAKTSVPLMHQVVVAQLAAARQGTAKTKRRGEVSGAGRKAEVDYLFVECNESVRPYGVPKHRHLSEIEEQLALAAGGPVTIQFTPHLIPVNRGILTTLYLAPARHFKSAEETAALGAQIAACYQAAYADEPFVRVLEGKALPDTKNVVGTNVLELAWRLDPRTGRLLVMSAEDNIVKGASGQAVQSFNVMFGFPETAGLF